MSKSVNKDIDTDEVVKDILANVMHMTYKKDPDDPEKSIALWRKHIDETCHDAEKFFGNNSQGYDQYLTFVKANDKDKYMLAQQKAKQKALQKQLLQR